jgi:hypothetical protein
MKTQLQELSKQERIDFIASKLGKENNSPTLNPDWYAEALDICIDQDVWLYEPDFSDPYHQMVFANFRLEATDGTQFHIACRLDENSQVLEWIGPFDITFMCPSIIAEEKLAA